MNIILTEVFPWLGFPRKSGVHVLMVDVFIVVVNHSLISVRSDLKCSELIHPPSQSCYGFNKVMFYRLCKEINLIGLLSYTSIIVYYQKPMLFCGQHCMAKIWPGIGSRWLGLKVLAVVLFASWTGGMLIICY